MGFAASSARLYMLIARRSDLEFQLQQIQQARLRLANVQDRVALSFTNMEPESQQQQQFEVMQASLQRMEKRLEIFAQRVTNQRDAINQEIDAVKKVIDNNIQSSFKLMG
jgi:leucyl-tRNA synthetase